MKNETKIERTSDRELIATRTVNGPAQLVFEAWTDPELFLKWWLPESAPISLVSNEMDIRTGGKYCLVLAAGGQNMAFFGKYIEVTPHSRLVWSNDEGGEDSTSITSVTFEELNESTQVIVHELYPTKESLDQAIASESTGAWPEQFQQLDRILAKI